MLRVAALRLIGSLTLSDQLCGCVGVVLTGRVEGTDFRLIKRCLETKKGFAVKHHPTLGTVVWICQHRYRSCANLSVGLWDPAKGRESNASQAGETGTLCRGDVTICRGCWLPQHYCDALNVANIILFKRRLFISRLNTFQFAICCVCRDLTASRGSRVANISCKIPPSNHSSGKHKTVTGWGARW